MHPELNVNADKNAKNCSRWVLQWPRNWLTYQSGIRSQFWKLILKNLQSENKYSNFWTIFTNFVHNTAWQRSHWGRLEKAEKVSYHSIYIRTVSSYCLLSALLNWFKLVYGPLGQSNMPNMLYFCPRPARKETNVPLYKQSYELVELINLTVLLFKRS